MSNAIIPMINDRYGDIAISDAVIANTQNMDNRIRPFCIQTYSCEYSFINSGLIPSKCIHIEFKRGSLITRLYKKILTLVFKALEFLRLYSSKEKENKILVFDYIVGIDQNPKYNKKIYEICKNLNGICIFLPQDKNYQCREVEFF